VPQIDGALTVFAEGNFTFWRRLFSQPITAQALDEAQEESFPAMMQFSFM
jgi:hypothetical protein